MPSTVAPLDPSSPSSPTSSPRPGSLLCLRFLIDFRSFSRVQGMLLLPNSVMLAAFIFCHVYSFQSPNLLRPVTIGHTANFLLTSLMGMYSFAVQWPLLSAMLHASSAATRAKTASLRKSSRAQQVDEEAAILVPTRAPGARKSKASTTRKEKQALTPHEIALRQVKLIGPEWVQIALFIAIHLLVGPRTWWNIMTACSVGTVFLQLCRSCAIGVVRREFNGRDGGVVRYVRSFVFRFILGLLVCMFLLSYAMMMAFSLSAVMTAEEGGVLAEIDFSVLPSVPFCAANINQTYVDAYCTHAYPAIGWWQPSMRRETCNDGGWANLYRSMYDACEARFVYDGLAEIIIFGLLASVSVFGLLMGFEIILGIAPDLAHATLSSIHKVAGSLLMLGAIFCYALSGFFVPLEISRMLTAKPGSASDARTGYTLGSALSGTNLGTFWAPMLIGPLIGMLVLLSVEFVRRKYSPRLNRSHFLSYKQNDGNDGVLVMLYQVLPGQTWLDKYADDRSTAGMTAGVEQSDVFVAILSPHYFESAFCCLEMYTAMKRRKPIMCGWNLSKHKVQDALAWIPAELAHLKNVELRPIHEDSEMMEACMKKIQDFELKPFNGSEPPLEIDGFPNWAKGVAMYEGDHGKRESLASDTQKLLPNHADADIGALP